MRNLIIALSMLAFIAGFATCYISPFTQPTSYTSLNERVDPVEALPYQKSNYEARNK